MTSWKHCWQWGKPKRDSEGWLWLVPVAAASKFHAWMCYNLFFLWWWQVLSNINYWWMLVVWTIFDHFRFSISWECHHPNWCSYFQRVGIPPASEVWSSKCIHQWFWILWPPPVRPSHPRNAETFYKQLIAEDTQGSAEDAWRCVEGSCFWGHGNN